MRQRRPAHRQALVVFFRVPRLGAVKKRLAREIGRDAALDAYVSMLTATFRRSIAVQHADVFGFYEGASPGPACIFPGVSYLKQEGADLGEKMLDAFIALFSRGYRCVVIVGVDSPDLPPLFIDAAFDQLDTHDVVIGPSHDGGYYLIGMKKPHPTLFQGILWGGPEVLGETAAKARDAGVTVSLLPGWYDIDDAEGLSRWREGVARAGGGGS